MDDDSQAEQQARETIQHAEERAAIRFVAGDGKGRRFLLTLLDWTGLNAVSGSERREGHRDIGRRLVDLMNDVDPMLYPSLCAEIAREEITRREVEARSHG